MGYLQISSGCGTTSDEVRLWRETRSKRRHWEYRPDASAVEYLSFHFFFCCKPQRLYLLLCQRHAIMPAQCKLYSPTMYPSLSLRPGIAGTRIFRNDYCVSAQLWLCDHIRSRSDRRSALPCPRFLLVVAEPRRQLAQASHCRCCCASPKAHIKYNRTLFPSFLT